MRCRIEMGDVFPGRGIEEGVRQGIPAVRAHGVTVNGLFLLDEHNVPTVNMGAIRFRYDPKLHGKTKNFIQIGEKIPGVKGEDGEEVVHVHSAADGLYMGIIPYKLLSNFLRSAN